MTINELKNKFVFTRMIISKSDVAGFMIAFLCIAYGLGGLLWNLCKWVMSLHH